jgi:5-deoxy-glucuronate isomerase
MTRSSTPSTVTPTHHPWHRPAGSAAHGPGTPVALTPADAGWTYCGLQVWSMAAGETRPLTTAGVETAVLPLSGSFVLEVAGDRFDLDGRRDVFSRVTDWAYVPVDAQARLTSTQGGEVALPAAVAREPFPPVYVPATSVAIEIRGAGPSTRQMTNFMSPEVFDGAHRLMCVEVLTPDGNWSSYPPHRHDGEGECVVNNEEIYYFRVGAPSTGNTSGGYSRAGFAMHRAYTADGAVDANVAVRDGDSFLIPRGYHGPCVAAPGYPLYYLNVLAGPAAHRTMAFCDDPTHHWVRDAWLTMPPDPRCPMTGPDGVIGP